MAVLRSCTPAFVSNLSIGIDFRILLTGENAAPQAKRGGVLLNIQKMARKIYQNRRLEKTNILKKGHYPRIIKLAVKSLTMDGRNAQPPRRLADVCAVQMAPASDNNAKERIL